VLPDCNPRVCLAVPSIERVVYSTCSVHAIENEMVVMKTLKEFPDFTLETVLPTWTRRGDTSIFKNGLRLMLLEYLIND
jgi:16S rRNA C967 or C1407 C5-methylase (RsmB/RsmF family)